MIDTAHHQRPGRCGEGQGDRGHAAADEGRLLVVDASTTPVAEAAKLVLGAIAQRGWLGTS